ncbi:DUF305 domain-containing protein [Streptomyces sp. HMX87]|uniref:DUF305 domain-containing protein n=1 Tax=Streptomyces sp. HMX87 TaxID=3390849 RepID=UPI003A8BDEC7
MTHRHSTRTRTRRAALAVATATAALLLAACGGDGGGHDGHGSASAGAKATPSAGTGTADGAHNAQDVAFAQGMIPHHRQALEMARLAADRSASAEVKDLAARIEQAQDPEIRTMTGWLKSWGEDVPEATDPMSGTDGSGHAGHTGMPGMPGMPGMMDAQEMEELAEAEGEAFDRLFLTLMVEHHEGAVEMATTQREKGRYGPAGVMAEDIVRAQKAEIAEMNKLLGKG